MNLIDRYIAEVGRNLPERDRSDIEAEIHSMLEDMVEEHAQQNGRSSSDEEVITTVLEELGDPRLLAARYAPPRKYLIGPGWYDVYLATLKRVLVTVLSIFGAVTFILALAANPLDFGNAFVKAFSGAFHVGVQISFWITLVFVLMERSDAIPNGPLAPGSERWTISRLPELPKKRQIPVAESIMNIAFLFFVMIWIALPAALAYLQGENGPVPFLDPDLWNFWLPMLFAIMGLTLIHDLFQLRIGNWTQPLMVSNVILGLISILYIAALVLTQNIVNPAILATIASSLTPSDVQNAATWAAWSVNITAAILIGIYIWDMVNSIRLARRFEQESYRLSQK